VNQQKEGSNMATALDTYRALNLYKALYRQLSNKYSAPLKANGGRWPNHDRLVVKGNTFVEYNDDKSISVRYHSTVIFTIDSVGRITLNSGGYRTYTTKARMNEIARLGQDGYDSVFTVHQKNFNWFVNGDIPFEDGMTI
jgi:hypothetical protein